MNKPVREIDGAAFDSLAGFFAEAGKQLGTAPWGTNLDAFHDVLRGGFGTPDGGFVFRWRSSARSREVLGYAATIRYLEEIVLSCHPSNVPAFQAELERARRGEGPTLFDRLVQIIEIHGPNGDEAEDGVDLELA